jgi:hypothetical protein
MTFDFTFSNEGSLYLVTPETPEAADHLKVNVSEEAQWFGKALVVEHRYALPLALALNREGFVVDWGGS